MAECQTPGVKSRAGEIAERSLERARQSFPARLAVYGVADQGVAAVLQVDADLVRAAGEEVELEEGDAGRLPKTGEGAVRRARRPAAGPHGHLLAPLGMAADRRVDQAGRGLRRAVDDRQIGLRHPAVGEGAGEAGIGGGGARHHEDAARPLVEPVDDAGPARTADAGHLGVAGEEVVGEGAGGAAGAGMDGEAGRLVEDGEVGILIEDGEVPRLAPYPIVSSLGRLAGDDVACGEEAGRAGRRAVDLDQAVADPSLDLVARQVEARRQRAVEALSGLRRLDGPGDRVRGRGAP